jgi:hypothetical protein
MGVQGSPFSPLIRLFSPASIIRHQYAEEQTGITPVKPGIVGRHRLRSHDRASHDARASPGRIAEIELKQETPQ